MTMTGVSGSRLGELGVGRDDDTNFIFNTTRTHPLSTQWLPNLSGNIYQCSWQLYLYSGRETYHSSATAILLPMYRCTPGVLMLSELVKYQNIS